MERFVEMYNGCGFLVEVRRKIAEARGRQKIEIYETVSLGKMLVIDGKIQLTEFDEVFYHEMIAHVPMLTHPNPRKVLIIGGGDGGTLREILKHDVREVVLVEIDEKVVELAKKHLRIDAGAFEDERLTLHFEDGKRYVESCDKFDVIIVDSTDPVGVSDTLFSGEFFDAAAKKCDVFCCQAQSPLIQKEYFRAVLRNSKAFRKRKVFTSVVPTYPLALWAFLLAGDVDRFYEERFKILRGKVRHYNPEVHKAAFALPEWLRREVEECI